MSNIEKRPENESFGSLKVFDSDGYYGIITTKLKITLLSVCKYCQQACPDIVKGDFICLIT
jgi:hypothetical protein